MVQWDWLRLDRDSSLPLYQQLATALAARIRSRSLATGEQLPASRELAASLGLNRATVSNAYASLVEQGLARSHVGQGTFVLAAEASSTPFEFRLSRAIIESEGASGQTSLVPESGRFVDFATLVPDEELFPVDSFREVLNDILLSDGKQLLQYGPATGFPPLRRYIAERLELRGVRADETNVLIVNGSQQGLDLICRALIDPGDAVCVERPTYSIVPALLRHYHAEVCGIPMTESGIDLIKTEEVFSRRRPKFLFTMPTFHNPTGITMSRDARLRLVELAVSNGVPVVEDDFDSAALRYTGEPVPPLKALDEHGCVIHIGTFSKGLFPGLRLGWVVGSERVIDAIARAKLFSDYHSPPLLQAAVLEFCQRGHYERHINKLTEIYSAKASAMSRALGDHLPEEVTWSAPEGGYAFWVRLPEGVSASELARQAAAENVLIAPGPSFFVGKGGETQFRLSISKVPEKEIDQGIRVLGRLIESTIQKQSLPQTGGKKSRSFQEPAFHI